MSQKTWPARGYGKTGSESEKATSAGFSQRERVQHAPHLRAPGASSDVGTSSGNCAAPAFDSGVGNGAS